MSRFFLGHPIIQQGFLHIYRTGPVWHPSIQPSNGLFFNNMSHFFWVIQSSNRGFYIYIKQDQFGIHPSNHPTVYFSTLYPVFFGSSNHPTVYFSTICPFFWVIQSSYRGFYIYIKQDQFGIHPTNHPT